VELEIASTQIILTQPSSTVLIYLLGLLTIGVGVYFLRIRDGQHSRLWWGIALLLWGLGALAAGTSYQAFSYAIKCAGREYCTWTSWWEIIYLLLTVMSVNAMTIGVAHSSAAGRWRKVLSAYAVLNASVYAVTVLIGAFVPVKLLISFELLLLFSASTILLLSIVNGWRLYRVRQRADAVLLGTWIGLGISTGAYYLYLESGLTQQLWASGTWFSENDVLHIGLILWMIYIALAVARRVEDAAGC
jgi:hypothetical protein